MSFSKHKKRKLIGLFSLCSFLKKLLIQWKLILKRKGLVNFHLIEVVKLVDTLGLGSNSKKSRGSSPLFDNLLKEFFIVKQVYRKRLLINFFNLVWNLVFSGVYR